MQLRKVVPHAAWNMYFQKSPQISAVERRVSPLKGPHTDVEKAGRKPPRVVKGGWVQRAGG